MPTKKPTEAKKTQESHLQKIKKLEDDIKQLQAEANDKNDKYLRTLADYQNYQRRMDKELTSRGDELKKKYLSELLDLQELLKQAYEDANPKEGLKLLIGNLDKFLVKEGVAYIDCKGKPFDYTFYHAVSTVEKEDCAEGTVIDEVKKGYMVGDKLLRPCHVIVAKKKKTQP